MKKKTIQAVCLVAMTMSATCMGSGTTVMAAQTAKAAESETTTETKKTTETKALPETEMTEEAEQPVTLAEEVLQENLTEEPIEEETEEVISDKDLTMEPETEAEEEIVFEPEYHPEQDPSPVVNGIQKSLENQDRSQIHTIDIPDTDWIPINGEKATCTSYAKIRYEYDPEVQVGTIRYISQLAGSGLFDWSYWGGWGNQAGIECGTASISMALSYVGVNLTPQQILDAHGGLTCFTGWGVVDLSPDVAGGVEQYINGRGQYSPVIVHLPTYSQLGHYVVLIGKVSDSEYLVLDCAQNSTWVMTVGDGFYNSIDQVYQYYNPNAEMLDHKEVKDSAVMATCTKMGLTAGSHCEVCGEVLAKQEVVPCNGHAWSDWIVNQKPTTERSGEKYRICNVCGQRDVRSMEQLPEELVLEIPDVVLEMENVR